MANTTTHRIVDDIAVTVRAPADTSESPIIILCHGFCGIQEVILPDFADRFVAAGYTVITFDYRGFGSSFGERGRLAPAMQIQDIVSVIGWAKAEYGCEQGRIGLWGTSLGGCHVIAAAANNPDIGCVIAQLPFADGEELVLGTLSLAERADFTATLKKMEEKRSSTGKELFVGITRVLSDDESKAFFEATKEQFPAIDVKIPFLTVLETINYKPKSFAAAVSCPVLVVVAGKDTVNSPEQGVALYEAIGASRKSLHIEQGARHYDIYSGVHFEMIVARETELVPRAYRGWDRLSTF